MQNIFSRIRNFKLPTRSELDLVFFSFSKKEWLGFITLSLILIVSTIAILQKLNQSFMVAVPKYGGEITEGIIGTPRFINPVLATTDADKDVTSLVYSGLMRKNEDGTLTPDLAEKYEMSQSGLVYTFTLKDKIYFHDGKPLTADDVIFTLEKIKDPIIKSPQKGNWDGVSAEKTDPKTIVFTLKQPYASFLENATLGIMPKHIWENSPIELNDANTKPIGSGPYMFKNLEKESSGTIDAYKLVSFNKFILGRPFIKTLNLKFYSNETELVNALSSKAINQASSLSPENAENLKEKKFSVVSSTLPRIFGLFLNQSQNQLFIDKAVVSAIDKAVDKDRIINEVLFGYGVVIDDPIPPNMIGYQKLNQDKDKNRDETLNEVRESLEKDGWSKGEDGFLQKTVTENKKKVTKTLEFSISTSSAPELAKSAELIKEDLTAIGMKVDVKTFDSGNLNQSVIRPRKYDALLFGQIINNESDLFAFWHSSQRKDPGLNIAQYTNSKVDKILEEAFITVNKDDRIKKYAQLEDEIKKDLPAVFLYSPDFIYIVSDKVKNLAVDHVTSPSARFANIYSWYIDTDHIWKVFSKETKD